jgi:hypothetical protein
MSNNIECPKCFNTSEVFDTKNKFKKCSLCKGKGEVHPHLSEDYISSINVINIYDDEFYNSQY